MIRHILSALCLSTAIVSVAPAIAQDDMSIHVSYADLNLASPAGTATFRHRLDAAVITICGRPDRRDIGAATIADACRENAELGVERQVRRAIATAQAPMLASAKSDVTIR